jgi:ceramide glucosyltransferase
VEAAPDFLAQMVAMILDGTDLVNCFYIMRPMNLPMAVEAVAVNADFWTQVLQGNTIKPMDFALGAALATTRTRLAGIGGFACLVDYLADDYQLGHRIAQAGGKLAICPMPVTCWSEPQSWGEVWRHQLRWARTIRVCEPLPYFFSILANGTIWPVLALIAAKSLAVLWIGQVALLVRALTAKSNYARLTGDHGWLAFGLAPVRDVAGAVLWGMSFLGSTVTWRGQRYRVSRGGKLTPLA